MEHPSLKNLKPRRPRRYLRSRITKKLILDTATELFITQGSKKVSIMSISKVANVGYGTVYSHFCNKDDLLCNIIKNLLHPCYLVLDKETEITDLKEAREYFRELTLTLLDIVEQNNEIMKVYFNAIPESEYVEEHWKNTISHFINNMTTKLNSSSKIKLKSGLDNRLVVKSYVYLLERYILGVVKDQEDEIETIVSTIDGIMFD